VADIGSSPSNPLPEGETAPEGAVASPVLSRRNMLMGAALMGASAIGYARQPQPIAKPLGKDGLDKIIPEKFGAWSFYTASGLVLPPDDNSDEIYDQVLTRVYTTPNQPAVALLLAYSSIQNGLLQLHRPEICYPASGFRLSSTEIGSIALSDRKINVRSFSANSMQRDERVIYWTRLGDELPVDWVGQRMAVVRANLSGEIPDGILVRVSTGFKDQGAADALLSGFVKSLAAALKPDGRRLLFGA
jgi:EpsI family protein